MLDNRPGDSAGTRLFAMVGQELSQPALRVPVDDLVGGQRLPRVKAHVQGRLLQEAEPSAAPKLAGVQAKVKEDAMDGPEPAGNGGLLHVSEVAVNKDNSILVRCEPLARPRDCGVIRVQAEHVTAWLAAAPDSLQVAAFSHGAV